MSAHTQNAAQLIRLHKHETALTEIDAALAEEPNDFRAYALRGLALMAMKRRKEALESATKAVALAPDEAFPYYIVSLIHLNLTGYYKKSETAIKEALRINPQDADYYDVLANLRLIRREYREAIDICDKGLKVDPENVDCTRTRAVALTRMGRKEEAGEAAKAALRLEPDNASAMATLGWTRLECGDQQGASETFRDALKTDPDNEHARAGLVEALKARNFLFRQFLRYQLWYGNLGRQARWFFILGLFFVSRILRTVPELMPLVGVYALFVVSAWLMDPIFNLFLRFDKFGRYALTKAQSTASVLVVGCILCAVAIALVGAITGRTNLTVGAFPVLLLSLPITGTSTFHPRELGKFRKSLFYAVVVGALVAGSFLALPFNEDVRVGLFVAAIIGEIGFTWFFAWLRR